MKVVTENSLSEFQGRVIRPANNAAKQDEPKTAHEPYSLTIGIFMATIIVPFQPNLHGNGLIINMLLLNFNDLRQ